MLCLEMACQAGRLNERRHFSLLGTHTGYLLKLKICVFHPFWAFLSHCLLTAFLLVLILFLYSSYPLLQVLTSFSKFLIFTSLCLILHNLLRSLTSLIFFQSIF